MNTELQNLITISNELGKDESLVVGTGGNTSAKTADGKYMYIKASGTALKDMNSKYGWRRMKTEAVLDIFNDETLVNMEIAEREFKTVELLQSACEDDIADDVRPSVEATLHVLLGKYIMHLHALAVLSYACAKNGKQEILELFSDEKYPPLWIRYADPGFPLSHEVFRQTEAYQKEYGQKPAIMILEKHGLVVADDSPEGALELVRKVIKRCESKLQIFKDGDVLKIKKEHADSAKKNIQKALIEVTGGQVQVSHFTNQTISAFSAREDVEELLSVTALTPDEMGFVERPIIWLENCEYENIAEKITAIFLKSKELPVGFLIKDVGLFVLGEEKFAAITKEVIVGSLFVRMNALNLGGINPLNKQQRDFIKNWEGEKFRVRAAKNL
jgi:rhamnose utilization protein RhaD (predicted bifunctional aldolase and dehydrogenase)